MQRLRAVLFVATFLLASTGAALAHAHLKRADPAADSVVTTAPGEIAIDFTEGVEPKFSAIEVQNAQGQRVDKGDARIAPADAKRLITSLPRLAPVPIR